MLRRPALVAAFILIAALPAPEAGGTEHAPPVVTVLSGTAHGDFATLAATDHDGGAGATDGYVTLDPAGGRFVARLRLVAAPGSELELVVDRRAPAWPAGRWRLQVRGADRTWRTVMTTNDVGPQRWQRRRAPLAAGDRTPAGFVFVRVVGTGSPLDLDSVTVAAASDWWRPGPGTTWQWQLQGAIDTSYDVDMYDVDLFATPGEVIDDLHDDGRVVICYFSAGAWESWRPDAGAFPASLLGRSNGWPGERWLDVRDLAALGPIMEARLDRAVTAGCDGVEPDNVDGYANDTGFPISGADQLAFNRFLADAAHDRGLSIGLKNDLDQIPALVDHFDWALDEQCFEYDECALLRPFVDAGMAVFGVEYTGPPSEFCPQARDLGFSWLRKREALGGWVRACGVTRGGRP